MSLHIDKALLNYCTVYNVQYLYLYNVLVPVHPCCYYANICTV